MLNDFYRVMTNNPNISNLFFTNFLEQGPNARFMNLNPQKVIRTAQYVQQIQNQP